MLDFGFYQCDCMDGMKEFPDKYFELAIVDPPYGLDVGNMNMGVGTSARCSKIENRKWIAKDWDKIAPNIEYFNELFRTSKNQIIWGGNYFLLPPTRCFTVWDKGEGMQDRSFSECEYAWTSFTGSARVKKFDPVQKDRIHPTQKPVKLYEWQLASYAKPGDKILDTHVGSASSLVACHNLGFDYVGFELDEDYYKAATERLEAVKAQMRLY